MNGKQIVIMKQDNKYNDFTVNEWKIDSDYGIG